MPLSQSLDAGDAGPRGFQLDTSNLLEYSDPELYDLENPPSERINDFLLAIAQEINPGINAPIVELGCGTGRFTIPLAARGFDLIGVDVMPGMITRAKQNAGDLPVQYACHASMRGVQWIEADARTFQLGRKAALIFDVGEAFVHVLTRADHEAILARVHEHLEPDGRFVLANAFLRLEMLTTREEHDWFSYIGPHGNEVRVSGTTRYDPVGQIYHEDAIRRWRNEHGEEVVRYAPLARRRFFPQELEALLHYNGFKTVDCFGDWDRSALTETSPMMIFVCQPLD